VKAFKPTLTAISVAACLAATIGIAHAAVYKYIDENGNIAYGDRPVDGSEQVKIHGARTTNDQRDDDESDEESGNGSSGNAAEQTGDETETVYRSLEILTPKPGKVVDERSGAVQVIFLPTPSLAQSDQLVVTVDGKDISKGRDANLALSNLTRGPHTVTGKIIDADGKTKISSAFVTFQVGKDNSLAQGDN